MAVFMAKRFGVFGLILLRMILGIDQSQTDQAQKQQEEV